MIICEPICNFNQHLPINTAMIEALIGKSKGEVILLLCPDEHWLELQSSLSEELIRQLTHKKIKPVHRGDDWRGWFESMFLLIKIKQLQQTPNESLIFLSTTTGILGLSKIWLKKFNTQCIFHSVLANIDELIPRNPFNAWFSVRRTFERFKNNKCKIIVLEQNIKNNLLSELPHLKPYVKCIEHPLPRITLNSNTSQLPAPSISTRISFPGTFSLDKGADDFTLLAETLSHLKQFEFRVIGKSTSEIEIKNTNIFTVPPASHLLARSEFNNLIEQSHFIFLGHNPKIYKWAASGVYLDALAFEKPIIARRSDFFENEFEKYGALGILFDSIEQLQSILCQGITNEQYANYKSNVIRAKEGRFNVFKDL